MKVLIFLCLFTIACSQDFETKPEQALVTAIVWNQAYHMAVEPPRVEWVDPPKLTCADGTGFITSYTENNMSAYGCVGGVTYTELWMSRVSWPLDAKYSTTSFSHELCHAMMYLTAGDSDPDHKGACFVPGGYVDKVNTLLQGDGL